MKGEGVSGKGAIASPSRQEKMRLIYEASSQGPEWAGGDRCAPHCSPTGLANTRQVPGELPSNIFSWGTSGRGWREEGKG